MAAAEDFVAVAEVFPAAAVVASHGAVMVAAVVAFRAAVTAAGVVAIREEATAEVVTLAAG